jgi:hypothetical protein
MKLTLDLENTVYWRLYCKAAEHGRTVAEELTAVLNTGNREPQPNAQERLESARKIRSLSQGGLQ